MEQKYREVHTVFETEEFEEDKDLYRAVFFSLVTDDVIKYEFSASDDKEAIEKARKRRDVYGHAVESEFRVWKEIW